MKMKLIITCLLVLSLLFACGCADRKETTTDDTVEEPDTTIDTDVTDTPDTTTSEDAMINESVNDSQEVGSISQEDLDRLKAELDDMEFDDVGGLSEE
jgi:PBP1b-binding outer membrane lipoprotein LpoB